jgi:signal transduction histidine kinase
MKESYGPLRFLFRATSPWVVYALAAKHFPVVSKFSTMEATHLSHSHIRITYRSNKKESRLMCIARQVQTTSLPTLWDLPQAHINEQKCIAWGDDCCEYDLKLYQTKSWIPILLGAFVGGLLTAVMFIANLSVIIGGVLWTIFPSIGALIGYVISLRKMNAMNFEVSEEINEELRKHVRENVSAKSEIEAANQRQREWSRLMEQQVAEHTTALENVVKDINRMQAEQNSAIRGYSHDLKNPFFILCMITDSLKTLRDKMEFEVWTLIEEQDEAVQRMQHMLENLVNVATKTSRKIRLTSERLVVPPLVEVLRRRLKAFVHGRDIHVNVFSNREAPLEIEIDRPFFDRVMDNLLINAAKYTEHGSITVELDGKPGFLTIKVSDTGRGIDGANISRIFIPGGSAPEGREKWSHGVGLSVVVRLLAQIGGKLDVMSLTGKGTTFWAHFPVSMQLEEKEGMENPRISKLSPEDLFLKVVNIRKPERP